ncbi:MAG TPA: xanthine dehydrogenase family protein molybdopterin-binding subunit [Chloroflexota bacterium]|nr:xanthine dehydrogenase family protein molybdopterin-binding subunit [Chloroflexota bacterium]
MATTLGEHVIGQRIPRVDALEKVTGRAKYTSDMKLPGMLYGAFLRSPHAHARIKRIDISKAQALPGVKAVITQASLAGRVAKIVDEAHGTSIDFQAFADNKVKYQGEKVAAIAAISKEIAEEATRLIEVEYDVLPAVVDPREAVKADATVIHDDQKPYKAADGKQLANTNRSTDGVVGDVAQGFAQSDRIFEDTYVIPRAHQSYIEPQVAIADVAPDGKVTCWTSTQGIFSVRNNIARCLDIPTHKVNVIGMTIGGGFGAKFGGVVDTYAVLLSQATGRPVKVVYNREEEFLDGRPAPGLVITIKTGVSKIGKILARQAVGLWDCGVQGSGSWATARIKGVYDIPNVEYHGYDVVTNKPPTGAYRAPGGPQCSFASEAQLNKIARALGIDPIDFRLLNMREGPEVDFKATLKAAAEKAGWDNRAKGPNEGWGVAVGEWTNGAGASGAVCTLQEDGSIKVFSGLMDLTGTDTAMAQIAAEVAGASVEKVTVVRGDTDSVPMAPGSGGSQITFSMGNAVARAAQEVRDRILEVASDMLEARQDDLEIGGDKVSVKGAPDRAITLADVAKQANRTKGGPISGKGSFAQQPSATTTAAQIVKVSVDPDTGKVTLRRVIQSLDCGKAINPMAVEGQMEGGTAQGIGWGLWEQMVYAPDGRNLNAGFLDYHLPTALDLPDIETALVEVPTLNGPFGAKGVGEPPITPGIAAVQEAINDATGLELHDVPFTPERVRAAVKGK